MRLALIGDICLNGSLGIMDDRQSFDYFSDLEKLLKGYDYIVANLEAPIVNCQAPGVWKSIRLRSDPGSEKILKYLGINAVSLANNHIYDYGIEGLESTKSALKRAGIEYYGIQNKELTVKCKTENLLFCGYSCLSTNPYVSLKGDVNILNPKRVHERVAQARRDAQFPVLSFHWGTENTGVPRVEHVHFADKLTKCSKLIIHGHHPHVLQPITLRSGSVLAFSLGNFCAEDIESDVVRGLKVRQRARNRLSAILSVELAGGEIVAVEQIPIFQCQRSINTLSTRRAECVNDHVVMPWENVVPSSEKNCLPVQEKTSRRNLSWVLRRLNRFFVSAYIRGVINRVLYLILWREHMRGYN
jgi:poly-gamma-glutamate synthesis protein (capsule biosynthesis protein)